MTTRPTIFRANWIAVSGFSGASSARGGEPAVPDAASTMAQHDGLQRRETVQRLETFLAAMPRMLDATERQFDAAARAVIVDEHLPARERTRHPELAAAVARPDAGDEAVVRRIGKCDGLGLVGEWHRREHGSEHFVAADRRVDGHVTKQRRRDVVAAGGCVGGDP